MSESEFQRRWAPTLLVPAPRAPEQAQTTQDLQFRSDNETWEDESTHAIDSSGAPRTGVMVAFYPTEEQARQLAIEGGERADELHLTLAFLGEVGAELAAEDEAKVIAAVTAWASTQAPVAATTNGLGLFQNGATVTYANVDAPSLPVARQSLVEHLDAAGVAPLQTHGYTPHMTLIYADRREIDVPLMQLRFSDVTVAFAGKRTSIPLAGTAAPTRAHLQITEREDVTVIAPVAAEQTPASSKAFVSDINGRTMITAPATAAAYPEPTLDDITANPLLWMHGKFVGAEVPNRNGALWSSGDLQMARATVVNGPLNWLHEGRHIIGTLAKADYVGGQESAADATSQPHLTATAAIWRWIYPDEAFVVQQASDLKQLWYSMECISKEVACAGPSGCGNITTYAQYMAGAACSHVTQRASIRQFVNPVFLGGAIIVPPTRPGWAEADASVMAQATGLAEAAFEQAGHPDVPASEWEKLMAQVVRFSMT